MNDNGGPMSHRKDADTFLREARAMQATSVPSPGWVRATLLQFNAEAKVQKRR